MNDVTLHHNRNFNTFSGCDILIQAETDAGRHWCASLFGSMADPIIDRAGLDIAYRSLAQHGLTQTWGISEELAKAISKSWGPGIDYADPIRIVESNDRLRITWDDGELHGNTENWMLCGDGWKRCAYSLNFWGSHPDDQNDDCYMSEYYVDLDEATLAFGETIADTSIMFITLHGHDVSFTEPRQIEHAIRRNPDWVAPSKDDDDDWQREQAQQIGMELGVEAFNDAMGQGVESLHDETRRHQDLRDEQYAADRRERRDDKEDGRGELD